MSAYHGWLISGTRGHQQTRRSSRGETDTVSPNYYPQQPTIPSPSPSVECPPNTRMSSRTSRSSSTTYVHIGPPISPYKHSLYAHLLYFRAREQLKLDSPARIIQNVFPPHSAPHLDFLSDSRLRWGRARRSDTFFFLFNPTVSGGRSTLGLWRVLLKGTSS